MTPFFAVIFVSTFMYVAVLLLYWSKWNRRLRAIQSEVEKGVSILVPFRNEEENLKDCFSSLQNLQYPKDEFEIIFIDDHSTDRSMDLLKEAGMTVLSLGENEFGKKRALSKAIELSRFSTVITLDADSIVPPLWLKSMMDYKHNGGFMAVGALVVYKKEDHFLNAFLNVEMCSLMAITAGAINGKNPLMANGTNLLFSKKAFQEVKGYEGDQYASGDDVFLIQKIAKRYGGDKVGFNSGEEALVSTKGVNGILDLLNQRARWAGKSKAYPLSGKVLTYLIGAINFLMAFLIVLAVFERHMIPFVLSMFVLKLAADTILTLPVIIRTKQQYLIKYLVPVAFLYPFYIVITSLFSMFFKPIWKGRSV